MNLQFFGSLDLLRRVDTGGEIDVGDFTLGDELGGERVGEVSFTLGSEVGMDEVTEVEEVLDGTGCAVVNVVVDFGSSLIGSEGIGSISFN